MAVPTLLTGPGKPLPLGLSQSDTGFNLAVFSRHATGVGLLVFDSDDREPVEVIALDPSSNRSGDIWHAQLSSDIRGKGAAGRALSRRPRAADPPALRAHRRQRRQAQGDRPRSRAGLEARRRVST